MLTSDDNIDNMKTDFKKSLKSYKSKQNKFEIIEIPKIQYLMIDGQGSPGGKSFGQAIQTLYPVAYRLKFYSKNNLNKDYVVPPLEALWWAENMEYYDTLRDKSKWLWSTLLMTPDWIDSEIFNKVLAELRNKKPNLDLSTVELKELTEDKVIQTLYVGPYEDEGPVIKEMHAAAKEKGYKLTGKHHEIYLSDFRKVAPEKLKTILRQPVIKS